MRRAARPPKRLTAAQVLALAPYAWWKADDLALSDGAAVGSWADASGNGHTLTMATGSKKPTYRASGLGGRPTVQFVTANATGLNTATLSPTVAGVATIFVVGKAPTTAAATQYLVGTLSGTSRRDIYYTTGRVFGLQGTTGINNTPTCPGGQGFVVTAVVNGTTSGVRHDTIPAAGSTSTAVNPSSITLGGRSTSVGTGNYGGDISQVIYFDRVLTAATITSIERYLAAWYSVALTQPNVLYVDGTGGDDTNNTGRSAASPLKTITKAESFLSTTGRIEVTGEIRETVAFQTGDRQVNLNACTWYGSERHTSGWTSLGGGIYSKAVTVFTTPYVRIVTDLDSDGFWTTLTQNTGTPTTPAAGQFGYDGTSTLYVHLAGNADPNTKTIEVSKYDYAMHAKSSGDVVIRGGSGSKVLAAGRGNLAAGASPFDGKVTCYDLESGYGGYSGCFATLSDCTYFKRYRCESYRAINDGMNGHGTAGRAVLVYSQDNVDHHNGDEGESCHDSVVHVVRGGWKHHNYGGGGITDIESSTLDADGSAAGPLIVENNRLISQVSNEGGISVYDTTTTGTIGPNVISRNNNGPGLYVNPGSTGSTVAAAAKAASTGNALPDVTP